MCVCVCVCVCVHTCAQLGIISVSILDNNHAYRNASTHILVLHSLLYSITGLDDDGDSDNGSEGSNEDDKDKASGCHCQSYPTSLPQG